MVSTTSSAFSQTVPTFVNAEHRFDIHTFIHGVEGIMTSHQADDTSSRTPLLTNHTYATDISDSTLDFSSIDFEYMAALNSSANYNTIPNDEVADVDPNEFACYFPNLYRDYPDFDKDVLDFIRSRLDFICAVINQATPGLLRIWPTLFTNKFRKLWWHVYYTSWLTFF